MFSEWLHDCIFHRIWPVEMGCRCIPPSNASIKLSNTLASSKGEADKTQDDRFQKTKWQIDMSGPTSRWRRWRWATRRVAAWRWQNPFNWRILMWIPWRYSEIILDLYWSIIITFWLFKLVKFWSEQLGKNPLKEKLIGSSIFGQRRWGHWKPYKVPLSCAVSSEHD